MHLNSSLRLHYFLRIPNVGDLVTPDLVSAVSGCATRYVRSLDRPHLLAIGSMMAATTPNSFVWGTGVMHPDIGVGAITRPDRIFAVRGQLSHSALSQQIGSLREMPLGDPGFLAPALLGISRATIPTYRVGFVPHYTDRYHPIVEGLMREDGVVDLNVHDAPEKFLARMAQCEAVISTSLHGLVFAEALGIPNLWAQCGCEIGGGRFKYDDWFTTMRRPQKDPVLLDAASTIDDLVARTSLHDCAISGEDIASAFPKQSLPELCDVGHRPLIPVSDCRDRPTPVFLISYNRGTMLQAAIESVRAQSRHVQIVVHDNGSDDPATLAVLDDLERQGVRLERRGRIATAEELNEVDDTIDRFFEDWAEPARYVVSDCDVVLDVTDPAALAVYNEMLDRFRGVECVGPMLRIRDIDPTYPLYAHVMNRHIEQFWHRMPSFVQLSTGAVAYIDALIDTTFALHRAGEAFRRLKSGIRVYEPYEARHLDWYPNRFSDVSYASTSNAQISHWGNLEQMRLYADTALQHDSFWIVERQGGDRLGTSRVAVGAGSTAV